jgi:hypothetical protein
MVTTHDSKETALISDRLNVDIRIRELRAWRAEWEQENAIIQAIIDSTDDTKPIEVQKGIQAVTLQNRIRLKLAQRPLEISPELIENVGFDTIARYFARSFAGLAKDDAKIWLQNLYFIMTPDLRLLYDKIKRLMGYSSFGQRRNCLLGGLSGMGKTTCLDWLVSQNLPIVQPERNIVPIIKVDAPVGNKSVKPLLQLMVLECGKNWLGRDSEGDLLNKLVLYIQKCGVQLIVIDEIEHLRTHDMRRHVMEISNRNPRTPIICASCHPTKFVQGDPEIAGRWNDYFELKQYTGRRLDQLLAFIELLLPFTQPSYLAFRKFENGKAGPAMVIEEYTQGVLRDIMILIVDASMRAIDRGESHLTMDLLFETWQDLQHQKVTDFLQALKLKSL